MADKRAPHKPLCNCRRCARRKVAAKPTKTQAKKLNYGRGHSRPVKGDAEAVLAKSSLVASADYYATRCTTVVTTADILRWGGLSMVTATPTQFQAASAMADEYNAGLRQLQVEVAHAQA